jgi:hypothetical protein
VQKKIVPQATYDKLETKLWQNRNKSIPLASVGVLIGIAAGCFGASGPYFTPIETQTETALIYIYRPWMLVGSGFSYTILANDRPVVDLKNGGYYPFRTTPAKISFRTDPGEPGRTITIEATAGQSYFIELYIKETPSGWGAYPVLRYVDQPTAMTEIGDCRLVPGREGS